MIWIYPKLLIRSPSKITGPGSAQRCFLMRFWRGTWSLSANICRTIPAPRIRLKTEYHQSIALHYLGPRKFYLYCFPRNAYPRTNSRARCIVGIELNLNARRCRYINLALELVQSCFVQLLKLINWKWLSLFWNKEKNLPIASSYRRGLP